MDEENIIGCPFISLVMADTNLSNEFGAEDAWSMVTVLVCGSYCSTQPVSELNANAHAANVILLIFIIVSSLNVLERQLYTTRDVTYW